MTLKIRKNNKSDLTKTNKVKMGIREKLRRKFFMIVIILSAIILVSVFALEYVSRNYQFAINNYGYAQGYAGKLGIEFNNSLTLIQNILLDRAGRDSSQMYLQLEAKIEDMSGQMELLKSTCKTKKSKEIFQNLENIIEQYKPIRNRIVKLGINNQQDEAYQLFLEEGKPLSDTIEQYIDQILELSILNCKQTIVRARTLTYTLMGVILILILLMIFVCFRMIKKITDSICLPLSKIMVSAKEMSKGNLDISVIRESEDEIGDLAETFQDMAGELKKYIKDISNVTREMAGYNMQVEITSDFKGEFAEIKTSVNQIILALNDALSKINEVSEEVEEGSKQVALGAQELADETVEAAGVVEQLTVDISEISEKINKNAQNAQIAGQISQKVQVFVEEGNAQMLNMVTAIQEIDSNTSAIQKIIQSIEQIASQTNLLSLNAYIEAARAGESGFGFAVVASEIRKLSEQSTQAAKNTVALIHKCMSATQNGVAMVDITADALKKIVDSAAESAELVQQIAAATQMQAVYLNKIGKGVDELSESIEGNSTVSEESAAAAEQLTNHAAVLHNSAGRFKLRA